MKIRKDIFNAALAVQIEVLKERLSAISEFVELNQTFIHIEKRVLQKQITKLTTLFIEE